MGAAYFRAGQFNEAAAAFRTATVLNPASFDAFYGLGNALNRSGKYQEAVGNRAAVRIIDGVNHMGIVGDPAAVSAIADDVATSGMAGS